jgi:hypothetical protein
MTCSNNLKQLGLAVQNYASAYNSTLPPALRGAGTSASTPGWANLLSVLLPYLEQDALYKIGNANANAGGGFWDGSPVPGAPSNSVRTAVIKAFLCPSDPSLANGFSAAQVNAWAGTSYAGNWMLFGASNAQARYGVGNIPDGTSNTVAFAERYAACGSYGNLWAWPGGHYWNGWEPNTWGVTFANNVDGGAWNQVPQFQPNPYGTACDPNRASTPHTGTCQVGLMDGSVRGVSSGVSQATWQNAITPDDGTPLGPDW